MRNLLLIAVLGACSAAANADPTPGKTTILGPFTGHYAPLHPDNIAPHPIKYYGTDLGWTYEHDGKIQFLFGDTYATEQDDRIQTSTGGIWDDSFGSIDLAEWRDASRITPQNIPLLKLGQNPGTDEAAAIDPGHAMESFKTPIGGFSNGKREFGIFYTAKPRACRVNADCGSELSCDTGLGFVGEPWNTDKGLTIACLDGSPGCAADPLNDADGKPVAGSGLCIDRSASIYADTDAGRISAVAIKHLVGMRSTDDPRRYGDTREWLTTKFGNAAARTVAAFEPAGAKPDYRPAKTSGGKQRVFLWARPGFIGVAAVGRPANLYFAYVDLPGGAGFDWKPNYYAGTDARGAPRFSANERDAVAVDLDSTQEGVQAGEVHDIVDQMSLSWVEPLKKWVMLYGGGMVNLPAPPALPNCGVLEFFAQSDCTKVVMGNSAIRMRSAAHPWGPWSPPQDVLIGGDQTRRPLEHLYAPGGILRHPACAEPACETMTKSREVTPDDYGFLYGVNIIEQWTREVDGGAELIWNVSTWDPYRVVLVRTRLNK